MDIKVLFVFALIQFLESAEYRVMNTSLGEITGLVTRNGYGEALQFLGIRYGKAPIGSLRFKPPELVESFPNGYLDATVEGASCSQAVSAPIGQKARLDTSSSEDCLFLNIYRPANKSAVNLAVMVYIHGGMYTSGAGATDDSRYLAVVGNVLIVTINYRLGLFGFVPNSKTESTLGIQDQILALNWVKNYIHEFGGDPNQVTIFGESAGGQSVSFLTVSPKAKGLFQRAISHNGVTASPLGSRQMILEKLTDKVRGIGCNSDLVNCLRNQTRETLVLWSSEIGPMPVPDGEVIPFDFDNLDYVHPDVDLIMGLNLCHGSLQERTIALAADEFTTDYTNRFRINRTASMLTRRGKNKVYIYRFNSTFKAGTLYWRSDYTNQARHGVDVASVFGFTMPTTHNLMSLWTDFAKGKDFKSDEWPRFTEQNAEYLLIDDDNQRGGIRGPLFPSYKNYFWNYYEMYGRFPYKWTVTNGAISRGLSNCVFIFALVFSLWCSNT